MNINSTQIVNALSCEDELTRLLPMIDNIAIIEYEGNNIDGSCAFAHYLEDNGIDTTAVNRIVLFGKKTSKTNANEEQLTLLYPNAKITICNKLWYEVNPRKLKLWNTFVLHIGASVGITDYMFDQEHGNGETFVDIVNQTRVAYYTCILKDRQTSFFDNPFTTRTQLRLENYALEINKDEKVQTNFCKDKQDYINSCIKTLTAQDAFFQCIDESEHGCEECNQCGNYGQRKHCPFAQREVARYYREGIYVPKDERIAHQWEIMAARQDYKPACIQVADDKKEGCGCKKDIDAALEVYSMYASQIGNEHCINQILQIAEDDLSIKRIIAIPFIAQQAKDGNEDMIMKLSDAFQTGEYGLPKDIIQQKEWIEQGAENGNPRFVKAMAEMYEASEDWENSYKWYSTLSDVAPELLEDDKLDTIELRMLTNGGSPEEVTNTGECYLYGYFGKERNLHFAYRCLKYGSDNNIAKAKGLLGVMYLEGWDVEADEIYAKDLLTVAAEDGDLFSMDKLTDLYYSDDYDYDEGERWVNVISDRIEEGIEKDEPFAYYLKGYYLSIGYQYNDDEYEAFRFMSKAAERNIPIAQYKLSEMYEDGIGTECSQELSKSWLQRSANNGYYVAQGKYGISLFENSSLFKDTKRDSFKYLKPAYEQDYEEAYWCLAQCYMNGYGTPIDKGQAYPLYQQAAEEGKATAQELLCQKYFKGDGAYLEQSYKLCAKWGEEAIKQGRKSIRFETAYSHSHIGNSDRAKELYLELSNEGNAAAMNNYACELSDKKEKAEWFQKAADKGDDYGMWNIAKFYKNGTGVEKDIDKALEMFTKSAEQGHTGAMQDLARMYRNGDCVEQNGHTAIEWYQKAADNGKTDCLLEIASIYNDGILVEKDVEQAVHYYKLAAENGNPTALYRLGELYENGTGVEQNVHKAIYWYRKAANKGNYSAKESLKRLNSNWLDADGNVDDLIDEGDNFDF